MPEERTMVLREDILNTEPMDIEARKLGGVLVGTLQRENSAMWAFVNRDSAHDFLFIAKQRGYYASIQPASPWASAIFPSYNPLDALREDAERIRRAFKKPPLRPPWAK